MRHSLASRRFGGGGAGHVTGYSFTPAGFDRAFLWNGTSMLDLGTLGGYGSRGLGINASGHVVGFSDTATLQEHAFLWDGTTMYDLNDLVENLAGGVLLHATGINDRGQITGFGVFNGQQRAFLLTPAVPEPQTWGLMTAGIAALLLLSRRRTCRT